MPYLDPQCLVYRGYIKDFIEAYKYLHVVLMVFKQYCFKMLVRQSHFFLHSFINLYFIRLLYPVNGSWRQLISFSKKIIFFMISVKYVIIIIIILVIIIHGLYHGNIKDFIEVYTYLFGLYDGYIKD